MQGRPGGPPRQSRHLGNALQLAARGDPLRRVGALRRQYDGRNSNRSGSRGPTVSRSMLPAISPAVKGSPIGMVSEGDLVSCDTLDLQARRDWWLVLLAEGEMLHRDFLASLRAPDRLVRDVMVSPVVTVGEETDVREIARLLTTHGIKRVPVVRDGRIVGIVSRADLVRTLAEETLKPTLEGGGMRGARPS